MRLTSEQNAALLACGYQVLPATPWQVWHLSQQRRIFVLHDQSVVVRRQDGFLETYGTLGRLLEQHAQAQALAMGAGAVPHLPEGQPETAQSPVPLPELGRPTTETVLPRDRSGTVQNAPEHHQEVVGPHRSAPRSRPRHKPVQDRDGAISNVATENPAVVDQAKVDLLSEFESRAAALGLSVAGVMGNRAAAFGHTAPDQNRRDGAPAPAKYRGPRGQEWSGRGRRPAWIAAHEAAGKDRSDFLISWLDAEGSSDECRGSGF